MVSIFLKEVALGLAAFFIRSAGEGEKLLDSQRRTNSSSSKAMHREVIEANENFIADDGCAFFFHLPLPLRLLASGDHFTSRGELPFGMGRKTSSSKQGSTPSNERLLA
jgi:hypothetical protein